MYLYTDSIFTGPIREDFVLILPICQLTSYNTRRRGIQMDLIYKWLEKRLFKRRHEVMKLRFEKIRLQQELERLKEQHEKID